MNEITRAQYLQSDFQKALFRLQEAIEAKKTDIVRDAAVQRFEYCFEICWKLLKSILDAHFGIEAASPKAVFRESFRQGLIDYDERWMHMTDLRNKTLHTYEEAHAEAVYNFLPEAYILFNKVLVVGSEKIT